ncbi:MAG: fumarylacetoacetate hydrolase family protein [Caldilineaceae bacterium]|nr:fumarylacetoacetate hydrolase family protein [Caldilineaceae bacterium]
MRIVRYSKSSSMEEDFLPFGADDLYASAGWGLLVDDLVYPLLRAPYLDVGADGVYAPEVLARPYKLVDVRLLAPVAPSKLVCVGRNYAEHAAELGNEVPSEPMIFLKPPTAVIGPGEAVVYPSISERVDHEGELGVVIGRRCRNVSEADAPHFVFGYTLANDVTARDLQKKDGQWTRGKGFDTFAPVGPWVDTTFDPTDRVLRCLVNGELRQQSTTALMVHSIPRIIAHVARFMTLEPGDLILTGTPSGIGPVKPGDIMTVAIDGLGSLDNPVVAETT